MSPACLMMQEGRARVRWQRRERRNTQFENSIVLTTPWALGNRVVLQSVLAT